MSPYRVAEPIPPQPKPYPLHGQTWRDPHGRTFRLCVFSWADEGGWQGRFDDGNGYGHREWVNLDECTYVPPVAIKNALRSINAIDPEGGT